MGAYCWALTDRVAKPSATGEQLLSFLREFVSLWHSPEYANRIEKSCWNLIVRTNASVSTLFKRGRQGRGPCGGTETLGKVAWQRVELVPFSARKKPGFDSTSNGRTFYVSELFRTLPKSRNAEWLEVNSGMSCGTSLPEVLARAKAANAGRVFQALRSDTGI